MSESYTVVIPAYNAERTIEACLASVAAQTLPPLEALVVDDESHDRTDAAVEKSRQKFDAAGIALIYIRLDKNSGPSIARNVGIRQAAGTFIAFLDADDRWTPDKLAVVDRFTHQSNAGLLCHTYSDTGICEVTTPVDDRVARPLSIYSLLWRNPAQTSCAVVRRQAALAFDESMRYCEDHDLWMRIAERAPILAIQGSPLTCLGRPQLTTGGLSGATLRMRAGELRVYYNFCRRNWWTRGWLLPGLAILSATKHIRSVARRWFR